MYEDDDFAATGRRITNLRKSKRLTQEQLASLSKTTKQTISIVESGKRDMKARTLAKIAEALDVSTDYLLTGRIIYSDLLKLEQEFAVLSEYQRESMDQLRKIMDVLDMG